MNQEHPAPVHPGSKHRSKGAASPPRASESSTVAGDPAWFPAPKHHAGEEVGAANGDTMVVINERCFQMIPRVPPVGDATHNGMGLQTYCIGNPKEPRGDLFKDLEAYKRLHPAR